MNQKGRGYSAVSNAELINNDSFERLRSRNRRRSFDEWVFIILVLLFLCAALFCVCGLIFFRAKEVRAEGGTYYDNEEILKEAGITDRDNLFFINQKELEERMTLRFPYIESITLKRILPTTLVIKIEEDRPAYYTEIGTEAFLLSESLRVLDRADSVPEVTGDIDGLCRVTLPTVTYAVVGRRLEFERDSTYQYMLRVLSVLNASEYAGSIDYVDAKSKFRISVYLFDRKYKVFLGSGEELEEKIRFFTNIRKQKLDVEDFAVVDVSDLDRAFVSLRDKKIED